MKFGIRKWLAPGEEVLFDSRGHLVPIADAPGPEAFGGGWAP